jgi:hypothetical protein
MLDKCVRCMGSDGLEWICAEVGILANNWKSDLLHFPAHNIQISKRPMSSEGGCHTEPVFFALV